MDDIIVTVLIAAYNQEKFIFKTIESVLAQKTSYKYNILVTDDASSDNTRAIIQDFVNQYPQKVFPLFNNKNIGLNETLKKAIPLLKSKYTCMLGGDDYWIDEYKIQKQVNILESNPGISFVHTGVQYFDEDTNSYGDVIDYWEWNMPADRKRRLVSFLSHEFTLYPCASSSCFRTEPFLTCYHEFPQLLDYGVGEGTLLHTSMCMYGDKYFFLSDVTTVYRCRSNSLSHFCDKWEEINFQLEYIKLKIIVFKLFDIPNEYYNTYILKSLNKYFVRSYLIDKVKSFEKKIGEMQLDSEIKERYTIVFSNPVFTFLYFWCVRIQFKIKELF